MSPTDCGAATPRPTRRCRAATPTHSSPPTSSTVTTMSPRVAESGDEGTSTCMRKSTGSDSALFTWCAWGAASCAHGCGHHRGTSVFAARSAKRPHLPPAACRFLGLVGGSRRYSGRSTATRVWNPTPTQPSRPAPRSPTPASRGTPTTEPEPGPRTRRTPPQRAASNTTAAPATPTPARPSSARGPTGQRSLAATTPPPHEGDGSPPTPPR